MQEFNRRNTRFYLLNRSIFCYRAGGEYNSKKRINKEELAYGFQIEMFRLQKYVFLMQQLIVFATEAQISTE